MNSKILKKTILLVLVICLTLVAIILPVACTATNKKAIIILPGIMGSNLIDAETGNPLWAPIKGYDMHDLGMDDFGNILAEQSVKELLDFDGKNGAYAWIEKMTVKPDGTSNHKIDVQSIGKDGKPKYANASTYGTLEYYEKMYKFLQEKFGKDYDVKIFEYDWRLDNMKAAIALEKFIKDNKYKKVTFVAHSMGGILGSTYIAKDKKNAEKVDKFITLGTPFFGSHKAIRVPENPLSLLGDNLSGALSAVKNLIDSQNGAGSFDTFYERFLKFACNLPTIYQLIPYEQMLAVYNSEQYPELKNMGVVNVDGKPITSYNDILKFLKGRDFSKENTYIDKMLGWQNEQFVEVDGKKVHASTLVDTRYFVGLGKDTEISVNYVNGKMTGCTTTKFGDGTVPSFSASCGLSLDDKKVYKFDGLGHGDLAYQDASLQKIYEVIAEKA